MHHDQKHKKHANSKACLLVVHLRSVRQGRIDGRVLSAGLHVDGCRPKPPRRPIAWRPGPFTAGWSCQWTRGTPRHQSLQTNYQCYGGTPVPWQLSAGRRKKRRTKTSHWQGQANSLAQGLAPSGPCWLNTVEVRQSRKWAKANGRKAPAQD